MLCKGLQHQAAFAYVARSCQDGSGQSALANLALEEPVNRTTALHRFMSRRRTQHVRAKWDKRTSGDTEGAGIRGDSLGAISRIKLSQGASNGGILPYPRFPSIPASWLT